jgi:hypothetical protein
MFSHFSFSSLLFCSDFFFSGKIKFSVSTAAAFLPSHAVQGGKKASKHSYCVATANAHSAIYEQTNRFFVS